MTIEGPPFASLRQTVGAPQSQLAIQAAARQDVALVTQPFMPPLEEFLPYLQAIWANKWLTNCGPFHQQLETALADYLGVEHLALVSNGTTALLLALKALGLTGEVITTPFSFVATTHALHMANLRPVFVDIDSATANLDPAQIERAITPHTSAIMPVHCFGHPCAVDQISEIAAAHRLKVIYDAAHAFGVQRNGHSLLQHGDASALSFHATKVFNTFEGGAIVCAEAQILHRVQQLRNFGFGSGSSVVAAGINGKMNELQAAFGLLQLEHIDAAIARRAAISELYRIGLTGVAGIEMFVPRPEWALNHGYFPVLVREEYGCDCQALLARLQAAGIYARRYFHPLICDTIVYRDLPSAQADLPVARRIARQILCLPIFPDLSPDHVETTIRIVRGC